MTYEGHRHTDHSILAFNKYLPSLECKHHVPLAAGPQISCTEPECGRRKQVWASCVLKSGDYSSPSEDPHHSSSMKRRAKTWDSGEFQRRGLTSRAGEQTLWVSPWALEPACLFLPT